ncbi:MAG: twin-arginine translocase TatA/TatE family subunit [Thaumarchaeota archaeon]|nr:twin-arginine translocase TatA/TatE family subunit [Nitrososphaerota archaeon]MCY3975999.1 twin-arginine translocase TatA/TatE family subunit [Nitrososphaerota archaeon]
MLNWFLNIIGTEWFIIVFVAIFLIFGTNQLPSLSKKFGKVIGKYNKTKQNLQNTISEVSNPNIAVRGPIKNDRQKLEIIAKSLDIDHIGKTNEELQKLISIKINEKE